MGLRKFAFTVSLLFVAVMGSAQTQQDIDDLHHQLAIAKDDTSRILAQISLCLLYRLGDTDSALYYGQLALKTSQEINYTKGQILALSFMSLALEQMGNLASALELSFKSLQIAKENDLEDLNAVALNAVGETYIILKDYPKALDYLRKQESNCIATDNKEGLLYAHLDMGIVFEETNQPDSALYFLNKAISDSKFLSREEPLVYKTLGDLEMKLGNHAEALKFYQKSVQISIINNERRALATSYNKIASFYKELDQPDSAIYYANKGLVESKSISQKKSILEATSILSQLYEAYDTKESLRYLKIAELYKDSLFGATNLQAIQVLTAQQEEHQQQIEAARTKYQDQIKQYILFAGLGILLLIALILFRNNRQKQKVNKVLKRTLTNLKLTQSQLVQSEKMASLGELTAGIAHEIQNPLNFVNNFSEVNRELIRELKTELEADNRQEALSIAANIDENEEKITHHGKRADAIVKGMLQHSRSSGGVKELTDINALADEYLRLAYHGLRAKDKTFNATLNTNYDETIGSIPVISQDIGRTMLNLISNAFYSISEKKTQLGENYVPTITLSTKRTNDKIEITILDNGNGIPQRVKEKIFQPFFTTKPTGQGTGLGLSLSYDIVKAHGGELIMDTKEGEYAQFTIRLPIGSQAEDSK